jgi:hypothetical protein
MDDFADERNYADRSNEYKKADPLMYFKRYTSTWTTIDFGNRIKAFHSRWAKNLTSDYVDTAVIIVFRLQGEQRWLYRYKVQSDPFDHESIAGKILNKTESRPN